MEVNYEVAALIQPGIPGTGGPYNIAPDGASGRRGRRSADTRTHTYTHSDTDHQSGGQQYYAIGNRSRTAGLYISRGCLILYRLPSLTTRQPFSMGTAAIWDNRD